MRRQVSNKICEGCGYEVLEAIDCYVSLCFSFISENSAPFVIVMSRLFISFISDSCKLLLLILFCMLVAFSFVFLEEMYSMRTFLYWDTFLGV